MGFSSLLLAALLATGSTCTAAADSLAYSVSGSLVSSVDGAAVPHGHVAAAVVVNDEGRSGARSESAGMDADERGHFALALPGPGVYRLTASGRGFRTMALDEHEGFSTGVVVSAATPSVEVTFRLAPDGIVRGTIVDEASEPVRTGAQVTLLREAETLPGEHLSWQTRGSTRPDDLGNYEFAGLAPGRYEVMVQAQPWYATGAPRSLAPNGVASVVSPLDMAYPLTWYPGVTDQAAASVITLEGGEVREADLRLSPVPSTHLKLLMPAPTDGQRSDGQPNVAIPQIQKLTPGGTSFQPVRPDFSTPGGVDIGGLAPGTYKVTLPGGDGRSSILQIGAGSPRTLDLSTLQPMTSVTVLFDKPEGSPAPEVRFIDLETGQATFTGEDGRPQGIRPGPLGGGRFGGGGEESRGGRTPRLRPGRDRSAGAQTVDLAPGRYEVQLVGSQGQSLTGITATGAEIGGRVVTIHGGAPQITLHLATGRAVLEGVALLHDRPVSGAMILLVPASLGEPQSLSVPSREQSNTDGSFVLRNVIPGSYILVAIAGGWQLNLDDPSTLRRYLLHGVPVQIESAGRERERVEAQLP